MSDADIIDTIAAHRGRERGMVCDEGELWCDGCECVINADDWPEHILAALRERYAVVPVEDIKVGLARGDQFRSVVAAAARWRLREAVGLVAADTSKEADQ